MTIEIIVIKKKKEKNGIREKNIIIMESSLEKEMDILILLNHMI